MAIADSSRVYRPMIIYGVCYDQEITLTDGVGDVSISDGFIRKMLHSGRRFVMFEVCGREGGPPL